MKVILASTSPRRKELMPLILSNFVVEDPKVIEEDVEIIKEYPLDIAIAKSESVFANFKNDLVIGIDTVVFVDNQILEKPISKEDARRMIKLLSGRSHLVKSGVSINSKDFKENFIESTIVYFNNISDMEIERYLESNEYIGKSGGYGIQGMASKFIYKIEGDYYNVMGLPVAAIYQKIKKYLNKA